MKGRIEMNSYIKEIVQDELYMGVSDINDDILSDKNTLNAMIHNDIEPYDLTYALDVYLEYNGLYDYYTSDRANVPQDYIRQALDQFQSDIEVDLSTTSGVVDDILTHSQIEDMDAIGKHFENDDTVAEYLNMTDEEREQVEDEAYDLFVESMQSYITENTMLIRSHIREVYRWMIETGHMAVRPIVRKAPIEAIAELFTQLDEE